MSMGGAFTALGGDMSTLSQNPAELGVFRSSEISFISPACFISIHQPALTESQRITFIISTLDRLVL